MSATQKKGLFKPAFEMMNQGDQMKPFVAPFQDA